MKIFAPKYYSQFKCIASKCTHSCCIGWEIDVDNATMLKYKNSPIEYSKNVCKSIDEADVPHFSLLPNGNCPHLDENGLCKIITNLGEGFLCNICKEHPRFYNQTPYGLEVGLGISCEEASRIILTSDSYQNFDVVDEDDSKLGVFDFDPIPFRNKILSTLSKKDLSYKEKLQSISQDFDVSIQIISDDEWKDLLNSLEYLNDEHKSLFALYASTSSASNENHVYLERLLAYFVYRHVTKAQSYYELQQYLGLCLFLEKLACSIIENQKLYNLENIIPITIKISEEIEYNEDNVDQILFEFI